MNAINYEGDKVLREIVDYVNAWLNSFVGPTDYQFTWEDEKDESYVMCDVRKQGDYGVIALLLGNGDDGGNATVVALFDYCGEIASITYSFDGMITIIKGDTGTKGV